MSYILSFFGCEILLFRIAKDWFIHTISIYAQIIRLEPVLYEISVILLTDTNQNTTDICVKPVMISVIMRLEPVLYEKSVKIFRNYLKTGYDMNIYNAKSNLIKKYLLFRWSWNTKSRLNLTLYKMEIPLLITRLLCVSGLFLGTLVLLHLTKNHGTSGF